MSVPGEFEAFFERVFEPLVGALWLYCGDRTVAEECAQESLARVARDWGRVSEMSSPGGWAHRVAFNLANSTFRRRGIERRALGRLASRRPDDAVDVSADTAERLVVRRAIGRLPRRQRQAVVLFYFVDLLVSEVAQVMGAPPNTVKSWLARARKTLERELSEDQDVENQEDADVR